MHDDSCRLGTFLTPIQWLGGVPGQLNALHVQVGKHLNSNLKAHALSLLALIRLQATGDRKHSSTQSGPAVMGLAWYVLAKAKRHSRAVKFLQTGFILSCCRRVFCGMSRCRVFDQAKTPGLRLFWVHWPPTPFNGHFHSGLQDIVAVVFTWIELCARGLNLPKFYQISRVPSSSRPRHSAGVRHLSCLKTGAQADTLTSGQLQSRQ